MSLVYKYCSNKHLFLRDKHPTRTQTIRSFLYPVNNAKKNLHSYSYLDFNLYLSPVLLSSDLNTSTTPDCMTAQIYSVCLLKMCNKRYRKIKTTNRPQLWDDWNEVHRSVITYDVFFRSFMSIFFAFNWYIFMCAFCLFRCNMNIYYCVKRSTCVRWK